MHKGKLTVWKDDKGFGFIKPENGGQEVFIHITALKNSNQRPKVGETIYYQIAVEKDGKLRAKNALIERAISQPKSSSLPLFSKALLLYILPLLGLIKFTFIIFNASPFIINTVMRFILYPMIGLILYPVMGFITFVIYAEDKSRARKGQWRIPEATLHLCELAGGWLGAFIPQQKLRHKSSKASYQGVFWLIVILHMGFWMDWLFLDGNLMKLILTQYQYYK